MTGQIDQLQAEVENALKDPKKAQAFLDDPAASLRKLGISAPKDPEDRQFLAHASPELHKALSAAAATSDTNGLKLGTPLTADYCGICKVGVWVLAGTIVVLGASFTSGGAALSAAGTAAIAGIANFFGVSVPTVQGWLPGLAVAIGQGTDAVAQALCRAAGKCN